MGYTRFLSNPYVLTMHGHFSSPFRLCVTLSVETALSNNVIINRYELGCDVRVLIANQIQSLRNRTWNHAVILMLMIELSCFEVNLVTNYSCKLRIGTGDDLI